MQILPLLAQAPVFLCLLDTEGRHLWFNVVSLGFAQEDVLGKLAEDFVVEEDKPTWRAAVNRVISTRDTVTGSIRSLSPNGIYPIAFRLAPVVEDGTVTGFWAVCWIVDDPCMRFMFSPLSEAVVRHLLAHENSPQKGSAIGHAVGESTANQASQKLRVTLGSLVERHILTHSPNGYVVSEEFLPWCRPLSPKSAVNFMEQSPKRE